MLFRSRLERRVQRSAKLFEPYSDDPSTDGILVQTQEELNRKMLKAYEMGLQPATHCIGDKGLDCVLQAIEYTLSKSREHGMTQREQADRLPFRVIHAQMASPAILFAKIFYLNYQWPLDCRQLDWLCWQTCVPTKQLTKDSSGAASSAVMLLQIKE